MTADTTFGVIGLGYVGLPLAVEAGKGGIRVIGFDVKESVVAGVNAGTSHIQDVPDADVAELTGAGLLEATTDMSRLSECDVISICVPTPLSKTRDPDVSFVIAATEAVAGGTLFLRRLAKRFGGSLVLTTAAYNAGPGAVEKYRGVPPGFAT